MDRPAVTDAIVVTAAVIERNGCYLLTRRPAGTHLAGRWEFPGGKLEPGESLHASLHREMLEELGVEIQIGSKIFDVDHAYQDRTVSLHFFACILLGEPHPRIGQEMRWVQRQELPSLHFPEADRGLIDVILRLQD